MKRKVLICGVLLVAGVGALARAAAAKETAERVQSSPDDSTYFRVVNTDWPFALAAEACVGQGSEYYVVLQGPLKLGEGQYHQTTKVEVGIVIERFNMRSSTVNGVFAVCTRCPAGKRRVYAAQYTDSSPPQWMQLIHDTINDRIGFYYGGRGGWFLHVSESEAGTDKFTKLMIGGQTDADSELGPFLHERSIYKTVVGGAWATFTPDDAATRCDIDPFSLLFTYWHSDGSVLVGDFGFNGCP